jgi:radical SAM protein with 4Fe4S-binding SPASM domain
MRVKILNNRYSLKALWRMRKSILRVFASPRRMANWAAVLLSEKLRLIRTLGAPIHCYVEVSSFCNLRCPMCTKVQKGYEFDNRNMTMEQFKTAMDKLGPKALTLRLWNFGEPLMNPQIFDMIDYANKYRVFTVLSTNGLLISRSVADSIVNSSLDFLIISFDGGTKESYEYNRRYGNFEKFIGCMNNLADSRRQSPGKGPFVALQFVIMNTNSREWIVASEVSEQWDFDDLMFRRLLVVTDKGTRLQVEDARGDRKSSDKRNFCSSFWEEIVVNSTGVVLPCCMDAGPEVPLGNMFAETLEDIWNGREYREARRTVLSDLEGIPICKYNCYKRNKQVVFK